MQVAQLGGGVQALVPRPKDPSVLRQQKRTEIIKSGRSFTVSPFVALMLPLASEAVMASCKHHGFISPQWWGEANSFHVCVTSYKLLMKDQSHFLRRRWRHIVLDEVQLIKNMTEKHWETVLALKRSVG